MYFADDWKVNDKLTLNMGLRWEIVGGIYEVAGRMSNLDPDMPNPAAGGRPGALVFAEDFDRKGFQSRNWLQLGPRFGFAYAVTNKIVARGGYSINNMPPVANFSLPSTLGYNGDISERQRTPLCRFRRRPFSTWISPIRISPAPSRTKIQDWPTDWV